LINLSIQTLIIHLIFFLIMLAVLNQLLIQPILKVMDEREGRVSRNRDAARKADHGADELIAKYDEQLQLTRKQAREEGASIRKAADAEVAKIIVASRNQAGDVVADIREKIAADYNAAQTNLRVSSEALGKSIASRLLGRQL
jgi:F-type H+-transporting ATPase subunit b